MALKLMEWINKVTKLNKVTMDTFQNNIKEAIDENSKQIITVDNKLEEIKKGMAEIYPNIYSIKEVRIGTDPVDGKGIYRKKFIIGDVIGDQTVRYFDAGIENLDRIINLYGGFTFDTDKSFVPFNFYNAKFGTGCSLYYTGSKFSYNSALNGTNGEVYVEYKKTVD